MNMLLSAASCLLAVVWYGLWLWGGEHQTDLVAAGGCGAWAVVFALWAVYDALRDIERVLRRAKP